jgi:SAM-dependent methyltransferase
VNFRYEAKPEYLQTGRFEICLASAIGYQPADINCECDSQNLMNSVPRCPICLTESGKTIEFRRDKRLDQWRVEGGDRELYSWLFCPRCANLYPSHQPDLRILRREWESLRVPQELQEAESIRQRREALGKVGAERSYRFFVPLVNGPPGRFLDIGCGFGHTVRKFADHGWAAEGIDMDPVTEPYHRKLGIRTRIGPIEQFDLHPDYSLIQAAHAIYFVTDPMGFLRKVREHLQPQGLFCIVLADLLANEDNGLPSYVHTFFPHGASMRYALALAGFETIFMKRKYGSIFMAARPATNVALPRIYPAVALWLWRTKKLRYNLLGRPHLALRRLAKAALPYLRLRK